ncbi:MAG: hypothetical protein CVV00_02935 [Firmicutes bacterium HGW-Firmicutes-5]|nr:MAG: hypothetical protein CVV00_02935 [Firmicutes bacterium HGW-Firmicutes-5]
MNKEARIKELNAIKNGVAEREGIPIVLEGETIKCKVFKIPLEYLIYNKYNGRIGSLVKSYEKQHGLLEVEKDDDKKTIEKFLYESNEGRNKSTLDDLKKYKQLKHGIVTSTGKIIDGNRRAMLLNKLYTQREEHNKAGVDVSWSKYFLAIILDESISDDENKVQELETLVQIGEDAKVDYNAIEKYLKCKELNRFAEIKDIAKWMNVDDKMVVKWLSTMELMDDYLETNGYEGIYTRLEKKEDPFLFLNDTLNFYKNGSAAVKWDYDTEFDVHMYKEIAYDFMRAGYEGKDFRNIGRKSKNGIFCNEKVWKNFTERHEEAKDKIFGDKPEKSVEELIEELPNAELTDILKKRDEDFKKRVANEFKKNMGMSLYELENENEADEFLILLKKANDSVDSINRDNNEYYKSEEALNLIKEITRKLWDDKKMFDHINKTGV